MTHYLPTVIAQPMNSADLAALERAVNFLEKTSFAQKLAEMVGRQIGFAGRLVPAGLQEAVSAATSRALRAALGVALSSLSGKPATADDSRLHRRLAMVSGALGGAVGLASLPVELPISTMIMLRGIAAVAREEGENLADSEAALACLQVFALGGHAAEGNILEGGYFALRGVFAKSVSDAAAYVAQRTAADEAAPVLVRLIGQIAARFGVVVSQKTAAQAVPLLGAMGGAAVNLAFTEHFQTLARGHFTIRRLERAYGADVVRAEYDNIARAAGFVDGKTRAA